MAQFKYLDLPAKFVKIPTENQTFRISRLEVSHISYQYSFYEARLLSYQKTRFIPDLIINLKLKWLKHIIHFLGLILDY